MQDGVDITTFTVAGRAEVRAYYVGTALCVAFATWSLETHNALKASAIVLGGFASSRVLTYCLDGTDPDPGYRLHQHAVFAAEIAGTLMALLMMRLLGNQSNKEQ